MMKKAILILIVAAICSVSYSQEFLPKHNYYVIWQMLEKDSIPIDNIYELNLIPKAAIVMQRDTATYETQIYRTEYNIAEIPIDFQMMVDELSEEIYSIESANPLTLWRWEITAKISPEDTHKGRLLVSRGGNVIATVYPQKNGIETWLVCFADESVKDLLPN